MNCIDFRRQIGSEPHANDVALGEHREQCASCAAYYAQMQSMDAVLAAAMKVDVPAGIGRIDERRLHNGYAKQTRFRLALAASALLATGLLAGLWLGDAQDGDLRNELIGHVLHEEGLLVVHDAPAIPIAQVKNVLERGRVSLIGDIGTVRHAGLCLFRGNEVSHLVIEGEAGPITVILLPDEHVEKRTPFAEEGFKGILVPAGKGSIAIIGEEEQSLEPVSERFSQSVEFSI